MAGHGGMSVGRHHCLGKKQHWIPAPCCFSPKFPWLGGRRKSLCPSASSEAGKSARLRNAEGLAASSWNC